MSWNPGTEQTSKLSSFDPELTVGRFAELDPDPFPATEMLVGLDEADGIVAGVTDGPGGSITLAWLCIREYDCGLFY